MYISENGIVTKKRQETEIIVTSVFTYGSRREYGKTTEASDNVKETIPFAS